MVKEGHAHFKVRGHRGLVRIGEIETREKSFQVYIKNLIERVGVSYSVKIAAMFAISVHTASGLSRLVGVELLLRFRREISAETKIALLKIKRSTSRKLLGVAQRRGQSSRP